MAIMYVECCKCNHQWSLVGNSFGMPKCEKCGSTTINASIGSSKPDWWKEENKNE